jgi:peptidoglycan/LPS O-acetylase OafA/YrhL
MTLTETRPPATRTPLYVGSLDGLRAIAVAAVIIFHFAPSVLPAGFLGVDVFFVVSGFLIARLVTRELSRTGSVSLAGFWGRRARRLLPALSTVTVVVLIATAIVFSNIEVHDLRAQALGTLFYVANWVLIHGNNNYFATVGRPSPFLHMWTLAVEEQFYVVLPLVFFAARRVVVRHPARTAAFALVGAVASTIWMGVLFSPGGDPTRAYLGTDSHAMGLLVGVAIGVIAGSADHWERVTRALRSDTPLARAAPFAAAACLVAIVLVMRLASERTEALYRGGFLVFAVLCGVIIVVVAARPDTGLSRGLGTGALVAIGLRSYSLYLWHWPVRVFITPSSGLHGFGLFVVRLAVSVVLAEISYRLIEQPFRIGRPAQRGGSRPAIAYYAVMVVITVVLVTSVDAPQPLPPTSLSQLGPTPTVAPPAHKPEPGSVHPQPLRVDIFGDSTGLVLGLGGAYNANKLGITVGGDASLGCSLVQTDHVSAGRVLKRPGYCDGWQDRWQSILRKDPKARLAVMAGAWETLDQKAPDGSTIRFGSQAWTDLITSSVRLAVGVLGSDGRTVYLFQVPCYGEGDANDPLPERHDPARIAAVNGIFTTVARSTPHVKIVPWRDLVCPNGQRAENINGVHMWLPDDQHLSGDGAVVVWKWWLPQLRASS